MVLRRTLALVGLLVCAFGKPLGAQDSLGVRLRHALAVPPKDLVVEEVRFFDWLGGQGSNLSDDQQLSAWEQLYFLFGSAAKAQFESTRRVFPARDTLGMGALLDRAAALGIVGAHLVGAAIASPSARTSDSEPRSGGTLRLGFRAPYYLLESKRGWNIRFPYYMMIGTAQTGTLANGVSTETIVLSTLFAKHVGVPGQSQATILINAAQGADNAAFAAYWLKMLGMAASDRRPDSPIERATHYEQFSADQHMHKEVLILQRGRLTFAIGYLGLPGTFESNRGEFLDLLHHLSVNDR